MKSLTLKKDHDLLAKIEFIEKEIKELKSTVLKQHYPPHKKLVTLRGIIKGTDISDKDISLAKKSLKSKMEI
jgi:hypothetical protein